jgi:hypothetical protein
MDVLKSREVCVMQNAETVLNVLREGCSAVLSAAISTA